MDKIEYAANDILKTLKVHTLPIDIFELCTRLGYMIYSSDRAPQSIQAEQKKGSTVCIDNVFHIFVNGDLSEKLRRQIAAHELGHILLHLDKKSPYFSWTPSDQQEEEADQFTQYLLAPPCLLDKMGVKNINDVVNLADVDYPTAKGAYIAMSNYRWEILCHKSQKDLTERFLPFYKKRIFKIVVLTFAVSAFMAAITCTMGRNETTAPLPEPSYVLSQAEAPFGIEQSSDIQTGEAIYITRTGEKYHRTGCQHIKGKDDLRKMTKSEAEALGYTPCKVCCK